MLEKSPVLLKVWRGGWQINLPETRATFFFLSGRPNRFFFLHFLLLISSPHSEVRTRRINHILRLSFICTIISAGDYVPEVRSMFCLSSSSLLIFSSSSIFMASNSNVCSLCNTCAHVRIQFSEWWSFYLNVPVWCILRVCVCYLQVLPCSLYFTLVLVFDNLETQLSVHSWR